MDGSVAGAVPYLRDGAEDRLAQEAGTGRGPCPPRHIAGGSMERKQNTRRGSNWVVIAVLVLVVLAFYVASFLVVSR